MPPRNATSAAGALAYCALNCLACMAAPLVSDPTKVHFAYQRYLKNELRNRYGWMGSPLNLVFKARKRSEAKKLHRGSKPEEKKVYPKKFVRGEDKKKNHSSRAER